MLNFRNTDIKTSVLRQFIFVLRASCKWRCQCYAEMESCALGVFEAGQEDNQEAKSGPSVVWAQVVLRRCGPSVSSSHRNNYTSDLLHLVIEGDTKTFQKFGPGNHHTSERRGNCHTSLSREVAKVHENCTVEKMEPLKSFFIPPNSLTSCKNTKRLYRYFMN